MKRFSLAFLIVLVSVLALVSASATALAAPATHESFSATFELTKMLPPERAWIDEEGMWVHIRGLVVRGLFTEDIVGQAEFVENINNNATHLDAQGKGVITVDGEEAYKMSFDITIELGVFSGTFVMYGMGSFKGIHITGTITPIDATHSLFTGTKLTTKP